MGEGSANMNSMEDTAFTAKEKYRYDELKNFFEELKETNRMPLGKPFCTAKNFYFYDTGTGKVLSCNQYLYKILDCICDNIDAPFDDILKLGISSRDLINALEDLRETVEQENILQAPLLTNFYSANTLCLDEFIENRLQMLTLEVTEQCNLRCDYCVYQSDNIKYRDYGKNQMKFDVARQAIDYFISHSKHSDKPFMLTFYGGEPLLMYELIKECVHYVEDRVLDKELMFSFTSNLTILTRDMAEYFAEHNFSILVSLDGDEEMHNRHRHFANKTPSFSKTFENLKMLVEVYGNKAESLLGINSVISAPMEVEDLDRIQNFWNSNEWWPRKCAIRYSYVDTGIPTEENNEEALKHLKENNPDKLYPVNAWRNQRAHNGHYYEENPEERLLSNTNTESDFLKIHNRPITDKPMKHYPFNACCIPCSRRLYVTTDGKFKLCEKIGFSPYIGDIITGVDIDAVKKCYIEEYAKKSIPLCQKCWASQLCPVCYAQCYDENGLNIKSKVLECKFARNTLKQNLIDYHTQLENDPKSLMHLNDIHLS